MIRQIHKLISPSLILSLWFFLLINGCVRKEKETMLNTKVNGLPISYRRMGKGPALILLHGFTQDSRVWRPQLEKLSEKFTVIAWDAPGAGQSPDPPDSFVISDWADCLERFLDSLRVEQAHILGLSWGGLLAQEFYQLHPHRVLSLILADTYAGWKGSLPAPMPEERLSACMRDASLPPSQFVEKYLPGMFSDSPTQEQRIELSNVMSDFHPLGFQLMATALAIADTRNLLLNIHVPTLLIWGDADKRSPLSVAYQMRNAIPRAKLEIISGAGHDSNLEKHEQFNNIVSEFLLPLSTSK